MSDAAPAAPPALEQARAWVGNRVDEVGGAEVGRVHGFFVDAGGSGVTWLIAKLGRRRGPLVSVPFSDCAGGGGRVWVAHPRDAIRRAPVVDPTRPLLREHELTICAHFGIGESTGRAADVAGQSEGAVTSTPVTLR